VPDEPDGLDELAGAEYLALVRALYRAGTDFEARAAALCVRSESRRGCAFALGALFARRAAHRLDGRGVRACASARRH